MLLYSFIYLFLKGGGGSFSSYAPTVESERKSHQNLLHQNSYAANHTFPAVHRSAAENVRLVATILFFQQQMRRKFCSNQMNLATTCKRHLDRLSLWKLQVLQPQKRPVCQLRSGQTLNGSGRRGSWWWEEGQWAGNEGRFIRECLQVFFFFWMRPS